MNGVTNFFFSVCPDGDEYAYELDFDYNAQTWHAEGNAPTYEQCIAIARTYVEDITK